MIRVASLFLPHWPIERLRQAERPHAPPPDGHASDPLAALGASAVAEQRLQCDAPRDSGWRPGARWSRNVPSDPARTDGARIDPARDDSGWGTRDEVEARIAALPLHQRPPMRMLGRRSEPVTQPFRAMRPDEASPPTSVRVERSRDIAHLPTRTPMSPGTNGGLDIPPIPAVRTGGKGRNVPSTIPPPGRQPRPSVTDELKQWSAVPAVSFPGDGPHPEKHEKTAGTRGGEHRPYVARRGSNDAGAAVTPFFTTGRTTAGTVARVCPEDDATRWHGEADRLPPLVTAEKVGSRIQIAAASPAALALGLTPGMPLTQARACVRGLDIRDADRAGDQAALNRLALLLARRWAPMVAISGDGGLLIELDGVAHLHGGEQRMAMRLVRMLARRGITARIAIADTAGAAWALSHNSIDPITICPPAAEYAMIATLPVAALRLEERAVELLRRLGVDTVGQLAAMPRAPLTRRFGGRLVRRLDQALGRAPEPLDPVVPREAISVEQRFAEPIATPEAIAHWLGDLVGRLSVALAEAGLGARSIDLLADRVDHVPQRLRIGLARAVRDPAHILRLMLRRIEEIEPGYGLDTLALHVRRADPLGPEAVAETLEPDAPDLAPLVDTLANRIGPDRLWRTQPVESDVPERSAAPAPPLDPPIAATQRLKGEDVRRLDRRVTDHPWHPRWPRPVRLLARPEPIDNVLYEMPDQPPRHFRWRGHLHRVVRADGPERITGEWWRRSAERDAVRDYFQVEDDAGARFWLFRRGDGIRPQTGDLSWYLHGAFG